MDNILFTTEPEMKFTLAAALAAVASAQLTQVNTKFTAKPKVDAALLDSSKVPFSNHTGTALFSSYVIQNLDFTLVKPVFDFVNATVGNLKSRGEAHITVIQPPEFDNSLKGFLTMNQINKIVLDNNLQSTPFKIVCLGHQSQIDNLAVGVRHNVYNLLVESPGLVLIRRKVYDAFVAAGGDPSNFNPDDFLPHITVGFDEKDWFEADNVYKTQHTCVKDVQLVSGHNPRLPFLDDYVEKFPLSVPGNAYQLDLAALDATNVPFTPVDSSLALTLDYSLIKPLFDQVNAANGENLVSLGSATIPVFSPFEFKNGLGYVLTMDKINQIAQENDIQFAQFEIACVAKQTGVSPVDRQRHKIYSVLVRSDDLHNIRKAVYAEYLAAGGAPANFNPDDFLPFFNVAFDSTLATDLLERDLVYKHYKTCVAPVEYFI
ncbi:hypothetical protein HDV01_002263 [Terramyces sp. JEL0728]|nr:hypothetical protein HDV01_002263 [Terramyces sp. JEL0728]